MTNTLSQQTAGGTLADRRPRRGLWRSATRLLPVATVSIALVSLSVASASADVAGPAWAIRSIALPTNFAQADSDACTAYEQAGRGFVCDGYQLVVTNVGSEPSSGPLTVRDTLPPGVVVASIHENHCTAAVGSSTVTCTEGVLAPGASFTTAIFVRVESGVAASVVNFAEVEGGGAAPAVTAPPTTTANTVNVTTPAFGVQDFGAGVYGDNGLPDVVAGGHPASLSTTINYTTLLDPRATTEEVAALPIQEPKTEIVDLPFGLVGDPLAAAQCPEALLRNTEQESGRCPAASVVGEAEIERGTAELAGAVIYNLVPEAGYPALFGFEYREAMFYLRPRVLPTAGGYVLSVSVPDITRSTNVKVSGVTITFFGDPTAHDGVGNGLEFSTRMTVGQGRRRHGSKWIRGLTRNGGSLRKRRCSKPVRGRRFRAAVRSRLTLRWWSRLDLKNTRLTRRRATKWLCRFHKRRICPGLLRRQTCGMRSCNSLQVLRCRRRRRTGSSAVRPAARKASNLAIMMFWPVKTRCRKARRWVLTAWSM